MNEWMIWRFFVWWEVGWRDTEISLQKHRAQTRCRFDNLERFFFSGSTLESVILLSPDDLINTCVRQLIQRDPNNGRTHTTIWLVSPALDDRHAFAMKSIISYRYKRRCLRLSCSSRLKSLFCFSISFGLRSFSFFTVIVLFGSSVSIFSGLVLAIFAENAPNDDQTRRESMFGSKWILIVPSGAILVGLMIQ